jgi:hypothetical protein
MQAIITKYLCPTGFKGARIKATCYSGSVTIPYDHSLSGSAVHRKAAEALLEKLQWTGRLIGGSDPSGQGYTFVFAESDI